MPPPDATPASVPRWLKMLSSIGEQAVDRHDHGDPGE
jgi:hypothetical protein